MSISVKVPKEITEYEEKIIFGLSVRKLICLSVAIVLSIGTYFVGVKGLGFTLDTVSYVMILEAIPLMAVGFLKKNGMHFEKYAALIYRYHLGKNEFPYKATLIVDEERTKKNVCIKEKQKHGKQPQITEWESFRKSSKKSSKRKCKETRRKIKAAQQECKAAQRRAKKSAKEKRGTEEHNGTDRLPANV